MLAELAIANAAFQVIKQTLSNGRDIADAGSALGKYFGAEKAIAKQAESGKGDVLALFQAKEQLRKNEEALKYMLNKQRLHGYADFVRFKVEYTRNLREAEKEEARQRYQQQKELEENVTVALKAMGFVFIIMAAAFGVALYWKGGL